MRRWLQSAALGFVVLAGATPGFGHRQSAKRSVFLECVGDAELHVLVQLEIPAGPPAAALALSVDADRSGTLDPAEERRLARLLTERALHGLSLRVNGERRKLADVRHELGRSPSGRLELMLHGRVEVGAEPASVELENEATAEPIEVQLLGGARRVVGGFGTAAADGGFRGPLRPAGRIRFALGGR